MIEFTTIVTVHLDTVLAIVLEEGVVDKSKKVIEKTVLDFIRDEWMDQFSPNEYIKMYPKDEVTKAIKKLIRVFPELKEDLGDYCSNLASMYL